jgi:MFS family permease
MGAGAAIPKKRAGLPIAVSRAPHFYPMYQIEAWSALRAPRRGASRLARVAIGTNVVALGVTSLLTDVSSEMVSTVLPVYLVLHLGLTPLQFGLVDGLYNGVTVLFRLLSGVAADRWNRHKEIAAAGYGISAVCKAGLGAVGAAWPLLAGIVAIDRMGKGLRTAPRDALISLSATPETQGAAFGVHRAFDSAGAMLGPLVGLAILSMMPERFDVVFVASFSVAVAGVGVLWLFVENVSPSPEQAAAAAPRRTLAVDWSQLRPLSGLAAAAALLGLATISDAFLYLLLQRQAGFNVGLFPLLYVGTSGFYLLFAVPVGRLADRTGRAVTLLGGHVVLAAAYLVAVTWGGALAGVIGCLLLLGVFYAATDGVLMALASGLCQPEQRASGMALVTTATSGARFVASLAFGAIWTRYGSGPAVYSFLAALVVAVVAAAFILRSQRTTSDLDASKS